MANIDSGSKGKKGPMAFSFFQKTQATWGEQEEVVSNPSPSTDSPMFYQTAARPSR